MVWKVVRKMYEKFGKLPIWGRASRKDAMPCLAAQLGAHSQLQLAANPERGVDNDGPRLRGGLHSSGQQQMR